MKCKKCLYALIISLLTVSISAFGKMGTQVVHAKVIKKNGYYQTALIKSYAKSDFYYMGKSPVLKKYKFTKKKLVTYGSYFYSKTIISKQSVLKKNKRTFRISSKCIFWDNAFSPSESAERISRKAFFAHVKSSLKRNMPAENIMFTVKKGKIVKMEIGQG